VPGGTDLGGDIVAVTHRGGVPVAWNEIGRGLDLLRQGTDVSYLGLSGPLEFDASGQSQSATTVWWTITPQGFDDVASPAVGCP
jgi:hypothetical protein